MQKTIQSCFRPAFGNLLLVAAMFFAITCWSSSAMPPPTRLDTHLERSNILIFKGQFERVVYASRPLNEKLVNSPIDIPAQELILSPIDEPGDKGQQFMEIRKVKLLAASSRSSRSELINNCAYEVIYVPTNINFQRLNEISLAHRELIGKEVLMFLSNRARYGKTDFPSPLFWNASGDNWNDSKFRSIDLMNEVLGAAKKANYVDYSSAICSK